MKKRLLVLLLALTCVLSSICFSFSVGAAMTYDEYSAKYNAFINDPRWAHGVAWSASQTPKVSPWQSWGCCAYASDFAYYVYGSSQLRSNDKYSGSAQQIRNGDIIHIYCSYGEHWFIVLERNGNKLYTAEGCYAGFNKVSKTAYWIDGDTLKHDYATGIRIAEAYHFGNFDNGFPLIKDPVVLKFDTSGVAYMADRTYGRQSVVDLSQFKPSGGCRIFKGWYSDSARTKPVTSITLTEDVTTVYALWQTSHQMKDVIIKYATLTETGILRHVCQVCGDYSTEILPVINLETDDISKLFLDIPLNAWYHDSVAEAVKKSLFSGTGSNSFSPNSSMTRAMVATVLYRMSGASVGYKSLFTDVPAGKWYSNAVTWAKQNGIMNGTSSNTFSPNAPITRQDLATILYRYAAGQGLDLSYMSDLSGFADTKSISDYAVDGLRYSVGVGIVSGSLDNNAYYLMPKKSASRAEVATMLVRLKKLF